MGVFNLQTVICEVYMRQGKVLEKKNLLSLSIIKRNITKSIESIRESIINQKLQQKNSSICILPNGHQGTINDTFSS